MAGEGAGPEGGRFFWVRHWAALGETLASVAVDEGGFVKERGTDGGMLDAVVNAAEFVLVGDGFADDGDSLIFCELDRPLNMKPGEREGGRHLPLNWSDCAVAVGF